MIKDGNAYVDSLSPDEIKEYRGTLTSPGKNSPDRDRSIEENLDLFERMKKGDFEDGKYLLRAKIDMSSPNLNMRDPALYRIKRMNHHRTGDTWCIYPMYDFTHPLSDAFENITHSICTLEFEDHRPLYNWSVNNSGVEAKPRQIEFARLNLNHTIMSKRKLLELVEGKYVSGWDDPRMPTISGIKRRGYTPESIKDFASRIGVAKSNSTVDFALLEHCLREDLNKTSKRVMVVMNPLKVTITNYPGDKSEMLEADNNPEDDTAGKREIPFSREIYIEKDDFMENPPKKYFRLSPGKEVRLKHAYYITCTEVIKDTETGEITEVYCTYDPLSRGGGTQDGRKVKGTLHWVSASHAVEAEVRLYSHLFKTENPGEATGNFLDDIADDSLEILNNCKLEPSLKEALPGESFQFLRKGYFCADIVESKPGSPVFNRTVSMRDTWAKLQRDAAKKADKNNSSGKGNSSKGNS